MTGELSFFSSTVLSTNHIICLANASISYIHHKSDVFLSLEITLKFILYVPNFTFNLLSVSHLAKNSHRVAIFLPTHRLLQDLNSKKNFGKGYEHDRLYNFGEPPL
ncbi:hypothetical protein U1Q18_052409 [Sarracenia purpurea var. burkii]